MSLSGWPLGQIALLFGGGAMAITALYLLRMRRRQVVVPFAALWEQVTRESESRRLWRRLRRLVSWLVQLAILAVLAFSLGDPRPDVWLRDPVTSAIVIDQSASMAAPTESGASRIEEAIERASAELRAMGPADRATVIGAGSEVAVIAPLGADPGRLLAGLEGLEATPGEADLGRAIALARHAVGQSEGAQILVVTDGALSSAGMRAVRECTDGPIPCRIARVRGPAANIALTAFAARRYPHDREHVEVIAEVRNLGDRKATVNLDVEADGVSVGRRTLELDPGHTTREVLPNLDAARSRLVARLTAPDENPGRDVLGPEHDDIAYAIVPPLRPFDVVLVSDGGDLFLEAALLTLDDHVRLSGATVEQARNGKVLRDADLVVFDLGAATLPATLPESDVIVFDPWRTDHSPVPIAKKSDVRRPFLTEQDKAHPILQNVVLKDVNVARGTTLATEPGDQVLVRTLGEPIVVLREGRYDVLAIGFDPRQSDLPLRVAFPLFIANAVEYFEQQRAGFVASLPVGIIHEVSLAEIGLGAEGTTRVSVTGPENESIEIPVERERVRIRAGRPGFYRVRALDGAVADTVVELAANQASVEASSLADRFTDEPLPDAADAGDPPISAPVGQGPLWTTLLLLACAVIVIEWASYHRRVTV